MNPIAMNVGLGGIITLGPTPSEIQRGKLEFLTFLDFNRYFLVNKDVQRVYNCYKKLKSLKNDKESLGFEPLTQIGAKFT